MNRPQSFSNFPSSDPFSKEGFVPTSPSQHHVLGVAADFVRTILVMEAEERKKLQNRGRLELFLKVTGEGLGEERRTALEREIEQLSRVAALIRLEREKTLRFLIEFSHPEVENN